MQLAAVLRRALVMAVRGHIAFVRPSLRGLGAAGLYSTLLMFGIVLIFSAGDLGAKDRSDGNQNAKDYEREARQAARRQQAEAERQRKEQERDQRRQMREAEEARKAAERDANKGRNDDWGRQAQQQQPRDQGRGPDVGGRPNVQGSAGDRPGQQGNAGNPGDKNTTSKDKDADKDKAAEADADANADDDDWDLTDAERRVREIERARQQELKRAQRESDDLQRREQARADRIRERSLRVREKELSDAHQPPVTIETKPPPMVVPARAEDGDRPQPDLGQRPGRMLEGLQDGASHLGMGRNALKDATDKDAADKGRDLPRDEKSAEHPVSDSAPEPVKPPSSLPFQGKAEGGEMPPDLFVKEKKDELIVTGLSPADVETAKARGFTVSAPTELKGSGTTTYKLSAPRLSAEEAERELHKNLPFLQSQPNYAYTIFLGNVGQTPGPGVVDRSVSPASPQPCPNKACFGGQLIKWSNALSSCTKNVRIGIIDTSFDIQHPAFKNHNFIPEQFLNGEAPSPFDWHGTAILSLLAGDPASGTPGLIPDATFLLATAFRSDANGNASTDTVRLLAALDWLERNHVNVVNMSFSGPQDPALEKTIARMSKNGVVFIAAAGNMGPTAAPSYPAAYPHVIAVTAVNRNQMNYKDANRGSYIDVSAPGVDILTALPHEKQGYRTGTSFAVPFVTAIVATKINGRPPEEAKIDLLKQLATRDLGPPGQDEIYGAGLALAPQTCRGRSDTVAEEAPALDSWNTQTTFIKAGVGFAP